MRYSIGLGYEPCTLMVSVRSLKAFTLRLKVSDLEHKYTYLTNRFSVVPMGDDCTFYVQMPLSPRIALVELFDDVVGDRIAEKETSFSVDSVRIKKIGLRRHMDVVDMSNYNIRTFLRFAQRFCYNAGWMDANEEYYDKKQKPDFTIKYLPILTEEDGTESSTPARINRFTGIIEVSKRKYLDLTVPERLCILCHEFSHMHLNDDEYNELEADLNGLMLYLALGFPRFEALNTFITTFYNAPSNENMARYEHIEKFVHNFDSYFNATAFNVKQYSSNLKPAVAERA